MATSTSSEQERGLPAEEPRGLPKKPYSSPVLTVFGQVAALTRSGTCSANTDGNNAVCQAGATGGMAMTSDRSLKEQIVRIVF
jgi:hypothetical protein